MQKYFMELCWNEIAMPYLRLKNYESNNDEYFYIPDKIDLKLINTKMCGGTINPYTREHISCNTIIGDKEDKCNRCHYLYDFYKCIKCQGENCYVKNEDVIKYCNTPHYIYLAYFPNGKIKVGTASEVKKYDRLIEQGSIFSILIAKTTTGKVARKIERKIINNGVTGMVTASYKMKNIFFSESNIEIKKNY